MDEFVRGKQGSNRTRAERAIADKVFDLICGEAVVGA
jgi:hypothetical protein